MQRVNTQICVSDHFQILSQPLCNNSTSFIVPSFHVSCRGHRQVNKTVANQRFRLGFLKRKWKNSEHPINTEETIADLDPSQNLFGARLRASDTTMGEDSIAVHSLDISRLRSAYSKLMLNVTRRVSWAPTCTTATSVYNLVRRNSTSTESETVNTRNVVIFSALVRAMANAPRPPRMLGMTDSRIKRPYPKLPLPRSAPRIIHEPIHRLFFFSHIHSLTKLSFGAVTGNARSP